MNRSTPEHLTRWLAAEDDLDDEVAEAALAELMADLPERWPSSGFAARVMTRTREEARPVHALSHLWARASLLGGVALSGFAVLFVLPLVWMLLPRPSAQGGVRLAADLLDRLGAALISLAGWANALGAMCRAFIAPFDHPTVLWSLAILAAVAGAAFLLLENLIRRERSWSYVDL